VCSWVLRQNGNYDSAAVAKRTERGYPTARRSGGQAGGRGGQAIDLTIEVLQSLLRQDMGHVGEMTATKKSGGDKN
jgi:hypothetical protein